MPNWDLFILYPIAIIIIAVVFYLIVKKNKTEKRWIFFSAQVLLTTTAAMMIVESNMSFIKTLTSNGLLVGVIVSIFGSWILFASFFKIFYAIISIKLVNRKIILQFANVFLMLALILCAYSGSALGVGIFITILQSFFIGATLGTQSIYFLYLSEQKFNKSFPLKVSFSLGALIVFGSFIAQWLMGLNGLIGAQYNIDKYLCATLIVLSFLLSLFMIEIKSKVGGFSSRIRYQLLPYKNSVLIQLVILIFILGIIYTTLQSPIFKLYLSGLAKESGFSDSFVQGLDRQFGVIFILAQIMIGYFLFKLFDNKVNIQYIFMVIIAVAGLTLFINAFIANVFLIWLSNLVYGSVFFMMYYFWFGFAIMWNSRAVRKPITGWVTAVMMFSQFLVSAFFNIMILASNSLFPFKSVADVISSNYQQIVAFTSNVRDIMKIIVASMFALHCVYSFLCFIWIKNIIAEYSNIIAINKKMTQIEKLRVERRINSRIPTN